jgi:hypothetical protein
MKLLYQTSSFRLLAFQQPASGMLVPDDEAGQPLDAYQSGLF